LPKALHHQAACELGAAVYSCGWSCPATRKCKKSIDESGAEVLAEQTHADEDARHRTCDACSGADAGEDAASRCHPARVDADPRFCP